MRLRFIGHKASAVCDEPDMLLSYFTKNVSPLIILGDIDFNVSIPRTSHVLTPLVTFWRNLGSLNCDEFLPLASTSLSLIPTRCHIQPWNRHSYYSFCSLFSRSSLTLTSNPWFTEQIHKQCTTLRSAEKVAQIENPFCSGWISQPACVFFTWLKLYINMTRLATRQTLGSYFLL